MSQSEQINEIAAALAKAQGEMKAAAFNKVNPHFKSKYADLAAVWEAIREPLSKNGLAVTQTMKTDGNGSFLLHTILHHASGQWLSSDYPLPSGAKPQELGSALTYARRYSLSAIVGIAADEDDDANEAQKHVPKRENPHVNRAADFTEHEIQYNELGEPVDNIPYGDQHIQELRRGASKREYEALQSEMIALKEIKALQAWANSSQTKNRVQSLVAIDQQLLRDLYEGRKKELRAEKPKDAGEPRELTVGDSWEYFGSLMIELAKQPNWKEWDEANRVNTRRMQNEDPKNFDLMVAGIKEATAKNVHLRSRN